MQRRYSTPSRTKSSGNGLKIIALIAFIIFLAAIVYGSAEVLSEIRSISQGQQILILKLTEGKTEKTETSEDVETISDDPVSKVEFIKFRNETNRVINDLTRDVELIQTKLKLRKTSLKK